MQARIVDLIARATTDQLTAELLRLNDELNNLFLRHKRYEKNRDPSMSMSPSAVLGAAIGVQNPKKNTRDDNSLIDLSEEPATTQSLDSRFQELGKIIVKLEIFIIPNCCSHIQILQRTQRKIYQLYLLFQPNMALKC